MAVVQWITIFSTCLCLGSCAVDLSLPPGFLVGAGTSSYQIEGAWNVTGKSESIWDRYIHKHPEFFYNGSNGDIAADSYNQWQRDIDAVAALGLDFYRFSISWSRVLPTGFPDRISEDGKNYYDKLINGLLEKGIQPVVTVYHWDMPQRLQDLGGWINPLIADWYADYARVLFSLYADRVTIWITINEPHIMCEMSYAAGLFAPGIADMEIARYICNKNTLIAHAKAWRIYDEEYRNKYNGQISVVNQLTWLEPKDENEVDAVELATQMMLGRYTDPIFSEKGGWPTDIREVLAKRSEEQGYPFSRLPDFTDEEIELIRGTFDYFGINYYTSRIVRKRTPEDSKVPQIMGNENELDIVYEIDPNWKSTASFWFKQYPEGLRRGIQWITKHYGNIPIFVTEIGLSTDTDTLNDYDRVEFYRSHIEQILLAVKEDKINVIGVSAWSLMDNFEWLDGYRSKFGLYYVNFTDPKRPLTPRASARFFKALANKRSLDVPDTYNSIE